MPTETNTNALVRLLNRIGVNAEEISTTDAEKFGLVDDDAVAAVTTSMFNKAVALELSDYGSIIGTTGAGRRLIARFNLDAVETAAANAVKVPRTAANVTIESRMVYEISMTGESPNTLDSAWWDAGNSEGEIMVNGFAVAVNAESAADHYEDGDEDRTAFVARFTANIDGEVSDHKLTSYGFTNLIRRFASFGGEIIG